MLQDMKAFFDKVRYDLFHGQLTQSQVDGINRLFHAWEREKNPDWRKFAYVLATSFHETGAKMQPIDEWDGGDKSYFFRMYDRDGQRPAVAARLGNTEAGDGVRYHGRGDVMLTGRANYRRMGELLKVDLEGRPELAKDPDVSAAIILEGMLRRESGFGDFTGQALEDYFGEGVCDPVGARYVVNGQDKAQLIAGYWRTFYDAIRAAGAPETGPTV